MNRFLMQTTAAAAALTMLAAPSFASDTPTVREVNVTAQVTNLDENAKAFYPNIAHDILEKIVEEMPLTGDNQGYVVNVEIQHMSLNGGALAADTHEFNQMEGVMSVTAPDTNAGEMSFPIKIVAQSPDIATPAGYVTVAPSDTDFYTAMITGFAKAVAEHEPETMPAASSK